MTYRSKWYNTETATDLAFADCMLLASYKWEVEKNSWGRNHYHINIILNKRADFRIQHHATLCICTKKKDWDNVIMHWERWSEDSRNVLEDQNLDVQTKYTAISIIMQQNLDVQTKYTAVSIIMQGVLDGTPKYKI
jgi:hypothetical protein